MNTRESPYLLLALFSAVDLTLFFLLLFHFIVLFVSSMCILLARVHVSAQIYFTPFSFVANLILIQTSNAFSFILNITCL